MKTTHGSLTGTVLLLALTPRAAVSARPDEVEDKAVKAIQKLGGRITRDITAKNRPIVGVSLGVIGDNYLSPSATIIIPQ